MTEPQKDDMSIIFSEDRVKVENKEYVIKPWTLKQLMAIWPLLSVLFASLQTQGEPEGADVLSIEKFLTLLQENPQEVIHTLLPHIPKFFNLSIKDMSEEEAGDLDVGTASVILVKIIAKNISHIKNSLSLVVGEMTALTKAMTQTPLSEQ